MYAPAPKDFSRIYKPTCLIGNWQEDRDLRRASLKDLLAKKQTGTLKLDTFHGTMVTALQEVDLTVIREDGYVHFGDMIQLVHVDTGSVLSCDVSDKDPRPAEQACSGSGAPEIRGPCTRNTFLIVKYTPPRFSSADPIYDDDVLHYGQKVRLMAHPGAVGESLDSAGGPRPLCLFSKPPSVNYLAKYSRNQLVGFTQRTTSYETVWMVQPTEPGQMGIAAGVEVMAGAPITLVHCLTNKPLLLENQRYPNAFGLELELSARVETSKGLMLGLEQSSKGIQKGSLPKGCYSDNHWTMVTGTTVATLPEPYVDVSAAVDVVAAIAGQVSDYLALERKLITLGSGTNELASDELFLVLRQVGCSNIALDDVAVLAAHYPGGSKPQGAPAVHVTPLLKAIKAAM